VGTVTRTCHCLTKLNSYKPTWKTATIHRSCWFPSLAIVFCLIILTLDKVKILHSSVLPSAVEQG